MSQTVGDRRRACAAVERLEQRTLLSTFVVSTTDDSGPGSLRQAILDANAAGGSNEIDFSIGDGGLATIAPASPFPVITSPVYLNGQSQPGYAGKPLIQISGWGLVLSGGQSTVAGLCIDSSNQGALLTLSHAGGDVIQGNYLGTDPTGAMAQGNSEYGIYINDTAGNQIGGTSPDQRNLISGNTSATNPNSAGVAIFGQDATANVIEGNYIGTNAAGNGAVPNLLGVEITQNATGNMVGGVAPGAGNVISGNSSRDLLLSLYSSNTTVQGNLIGTDPTGTVSLSKNNFVGLDCEYSTSNVIGGTTPAARNIISGHNYGLYLYGFFGNQGAYNTVQGNYIGTDINGLGAIPNTYGVVVNSRYDTVGGAASEDRNIVAGNQVGVTVAKDSSLVIGNYIGLNANGAALGNWGNGVLITGAGGTIGGGAAGDANVISANGNGVVVNAPGCSVQGNLIGTDPSGTKPTGNVANGVYVADEPNTTIGGTAAGDRNVISANALDGIRLDGTSSTTGNLIQGNYIGTDISGAAPLGNDAAGIASSSPSTTIGGAAPGAGNLIAYNQGDGIDVIGAATTGNTISRNSVFANVGTGIDLGADGPTPNHSGLVSGPNGLQNYPVLTSAVPTSAGTNISGTLNSPAASTFTLEFFSSPPTSGWAQGKLFLGSASVTTDSSGNASFNVSLPVVIAAGQLVTATASDPAGNTSEFSAPPSGATAAVVGRYLFYNHSAFDGNDPTANAGDDKAIATDKQALLPGATASFANYTGYLKGINGVMLDVAGLPLGAAPAASDFSFKVVNTAQPSTWAAAPAPSTVLLRPGAGYRGATRIELLWPDGSIRNQWLQVTLMADANTGLAVPDVFYFGNLIGSVGRVSSGQFLVTSYDELATRADMRGFSNPASITDPCDFNRDGRVNVIDQLLSRLSRGHYLQVLQP